MNTSSTDSESASSKWVDYFDDVPNYEELKHALFEDLYNQFDVNAEIIYTNNLPVLKAVVNYNEQDSDILGNPETVKNIYDDNLILRALGVFRGLDYLYRNLKEIDEQDEQLQNLNNDFVEFLVLLEKTREDEANAPIEQYPKILEELEAKLNAKFATFLKKNILGELEYDVDKNKEKTKYPKFLAHIRYLASLLDPSLGMKVIYNDQINNSTVTYDIYPITQNTEKQIESINAQENRDDFIDWATLQFNPLLVQDNTQLPALSRYTHLHTIKNAFIVKGHMEIDGNEKTWWYTRSATLAYVGNDCTEDELAASFQENIAQIRLSLKSHGLTEEDFPTEILMLTTDFPVDVNKEITATKRTLKYINPENTPNTILSSVPLNFIGTLFKGNLPNEEVPKAYGNKKRRIELAAKHAFEIINENKHTHIQCASGIDRTAMVDSKANIIMEQAALTELANFDATPNQIEKKYRLGVIGPMIGHLICGGSYGMKPKTRSNNWQGFGGTLKLLRKLNINPTDDIFLEETNNSFYWDTAHTNRERPIDESFFERKLNETTEDETSSVDPSIDPIIERATTEVDRLLENPYDSQVQSDYCEMLSEVEKAGPNYTKLLATLLTIFFIVSVIVGILFLIPSGGSSALVTTVGFIGLSLALPYTTSCIVGASILTASALSAALATFFHIKSSRNDAPNIPDISYLSDNSDISDTPDISSISYIPQASDISEIPDIPAFYETESTELSGDSISTLG